jgi:putative membrane protein
MAQPLKIVRVTRRASVVAVLTAVALMSATVASSAPAPGAPESLVDNETVYVVADASGTPRTTVVVDWLQVRGHGAFEIADPAPGAGSIESLTDGFDPAKSGDIVAATVDVDGYGDFFYRAETDAPLPIDISVTYFLDGEEMAPETLAGKSGRLRIELEVVNHLERTEVVEYLDADGAPASSEVTYTVPLLCVPQLELDGTRMRDVVPPEGSQVAITGQTMTYAMPMMPMPEATVAIEMDARDIELAPTVVSVFPTLSASPDFSAVEELVQMRDALSMLEELSSGHRMVAQRLSGELAAYDLSSMAGAADGLSALQSGLGELATGAEGLAQLSAAQYAYLDGVIGSIDTSQFDQLDQLGPAISQMRAAASQLETGTAGLVTLLDGQIALAESVKASNAGLLAEASGYAAEYGAYSTDATALAAADDFASLARGLGVQDQLLGVLLDGGDPDGSGPQPVMPGLRDTLDSLVQIHEGLTGLRQGLEALEAQAGSLSAVPAAFEELKGALVVLRDGGDPDGAGPAPVMPGLATTTEGLADLASGIGQAAAGLDDSSGQFEMLDEVPAMMAELQSVLSALADGGTVEGSELPGIDTTVEALDEMGAGLGDGIAEARKGEALTDAMKRAADGYTSFLGSPDGAVAHLSFLFKIEGVSAP